MGMDSSESSDSSSISSESEVSVRNQVLGEMNSSFAASSVRRSDTEMKLIQEAAGSLLNTLDGFKPHLNDVAYGYYCSYVTENLLGEIEKKKRKVSKRGFVNCSMDLNDNSSDIGSIRSHVMPYSQQSLMNMPMPNYNKFGRGAPMPDFSVGREFMNNRRMPIPLDPRNPSGFSGPRGFESSSSLGYSANISMNPNSRTLGAQSISRRNYSAMQAIDETVDDVIEVPSSPPIRHENGQNRGEHFSQQEAKITRPIDRSNRPDDRKCLPLHVGGEESDDPSEEDFRSKPLAVPKANKNACVLTNWSLKLVGEGLCVTGLNNENSQVTSGSVLKFSHPFIVTTKGQFKVEGAPTFGERAPSYIKTACLNGFPRRWRSLCLRWLADKQERRKSTPKKTPVKNYSKNNSRGSIKVKTTPKSPKATVKPDKKKTTSVNKASAEKKLNKSSTPASRSGVKEGQKQKRRSKSAESFPSSSTSSLSGCTKNPSKSSNAEQKRSLSEAARSHSRPEESSASDSEEESAKNKTQKQKQGQSSHGKHRENLESDDECSVEERTVKPSKRPKQNVCGSDTSWDSPESIVKSPTPKPLSKKPSKNAGSKTAPKQKPTNSKGIPAASKSSKTSSKNKYASERASEAGPSGSGKAAPNKNQSQAKKNEKNDRGKKNVFSDNLFDDEHFKENEFSEVIFAQCGGPKMLTQGKTLTPNGLLASVQPDDGTIGRYTPPMQAVQHLFGSANKSTASFDSPSSFKNTSRDNPVSRRMAKEFKKASKKGPKRNKKMPEPARPEELDQLMKALKSTNNNVTTPTIVKEIFRNHRDEDEDEDDLGDVYDESLMY